MSVQFSTRGWEDYIYWQSVDRKMVAKINSLIKEISRTPYEGTGNPEQLRHDWSNWWSRRIDKEHRLIYRVIDGAIQIAQCRLHY